MYVCITCIKTIRAPDEKLWKLGRNELGCECSIKRLGRLTRSYGNWVEMTRVDTASALGS